jgi:uncharacterized surface protein with fasciclin (FAS1) repeats
MTGAMGGSEDLPLPDATTQMPAAFAGPPPGTEAPLKPWYRRRGPQVALGLGLLTLLGLGGFLLYQSLEDDAPRTVSVLRFDRTDVDGNPIERDVIGTVIGQTGDEEQFLWLNPANVPATEPALVRTNSSTGRALFRWTPLTDVEIPAEWMSTITLTEVFAAEESLSASEFVCSLERRDEDVLDVTLAVVFDNPGDLRAPRTATYGFTDFSFLAGDIVVCAISNGVAAAVAEPIAVSLSTETPGPGDPVTVTVTNAAPGDPVVVQLGVSDEVTSADASGNASATVIAPVEPGDAIGIVRVGLVEFPFTVIVQLPDIPETTITSTVPAETTTTTAATTESTTSTVPAETTTTVAAQGTLMDVVDSRTDLSRLRDLIDLADLRGTLSDPAATITMFAPNNDAFDALPAEGPNLTDPDIARRIVLTHVHNGGKLSAAEVLALLQIDVVQPGPHAVDAAAQTIGGVNIIEADVDGGNGFLHILSGVLTPAD